MGTQQKNYISEATVRVDAQFRRFKALPICTTLDEERCMTLFEGFARRTLESGANLYMAGDRAESELCLITGGVAAHCYPDENILSQLRPGDALGMLHCGASVQLHAATVRAVSPLELLTIGREQIDMMRLEEPEQAQMMLTFFSQLLSHGLLKCDEEASALAAFIASRSE